MKMLRIWFCGLLLAFALCGRAQIIKALKVEELVKQYNAASGVLVVNFWSTWCKPCVEEIPHFISTIKKYSGKGVQLLLVSQDTKALYNNGKLAAYVNKKGWKAPLVWLNETNADRYCPQVDSSWSGVIPATLIVNPANNYRKFYEESLTAVALEAAIKEALEM